jgi:hypothetical protein
MIPISHSPPQSYLEVASTDSEPPLKAYSIDVPPILADANSEVPIREVLNIELSMTLSRTPSGSLKFFWSGKYPTGATLLHIKPDAAEHAMAAILKISVEKRTNDLHIPKLIDLIHRRNDSVYVIFQHAGESLQSLYFADPSKFGQDTLDELREIFLKLHEMNLWLNLIDTRPLEEHPYAILELFTVDSEEKKLYLVNLAGLGPQDDSERIENEIAAIDSALNKLFIEKSVRNKSNKTSMAALIDDAVDDEEVTTSSSTVLKSLLDTNKWNSREKFFSLEDDTYSPVPLESATAPLPSPRGSAGIARRFNATIPTGK